MSKRGTPEEALRLSVGALGGLQDVGHSFKREDDPILAGQWLAHCLTASKRDKLSLAQIVTIFRDAHDKGAHEGFQAFALLCGYHAEPMVSPAFLAALQARLADHEQEGAELKREVDAIAELSPKTLAQMAAAHLKVSE